MTEKKRLKLLPEVLPDPGARARAGAPRQRTLAHMQRMLAAATVAASAVSCSDGGGGYGVVDPMPPPGRCQGLAGAIQATGVWLDSGLLQITLSKPEGKPDAHYVLMADPWVYHAKLVDKQIGESVTLVLQPDAGVFDLEVTLDVECSAGAGALQVTASWSGLPAPGDTATVQISDK